MKVRESQRCIYCGRFLYNADIDLPFEIVSTGAFVMRLSLDINCGHCHRGHIYTIEPAKAESLVRIDK